MSFESQSKLPVRGRMMRRVSINKHGALKVNTAGCEKLPKVNGYYLFSVYYDKELKQLMIVGRKDGEYKIKSFDKNLSVSVNSSLKAMGMSKPDKTMFFDMFDETDTSFKIQL